MTIDIEQNLRIWGDSEQGIDGEYYPVRGQWSGEMEYLPSNEYGMTVILIVRIWGTERRPQKFRVSLRMRNCLRTQSGSVLEGKCRSLADVRRQIKEAHEKKRFDYEVKWVLKRFYSPSFAECIYRVVDGKIVPLCTAFDMWPLMMEQLQIGDYMGVYLEPGNEVNHRLNTLRFTAYNKSGSSCSSGGKTNYDKFRHACHYWLFDGVPDMTTEMYCRHLEDMLVKEVETKLEGSPVSRLGDMLRIY